MKTLSIEIRCPELRDARDLSEVYRASWLNAYSGLIAHQPLSNMMERRNEAWWKKAATGPATLLVLEVAGKIAGYTSIGANRASDLAQEGEIYEIYLLPQYQGLGLGGKLFGRARQQLSKLCLKGLVAWCLEDSHQANRFFRMQGGQDFAEGVEDFDGQKLKKSGFIWKN